MKQLLIGGLLLAMIIPFLLVAQPTSADSSVDVLNNYNGSGVCNQPLSSYPNNKRPAICADNTTNGTNPIFGPNGIVAVVVRILSVIVGVVAIIFIIVQGIKMSASGGDPQAVASARSGLIYAIIGLVVAVLAQVFVDFVIGKLT
jgi:flagellar biosynthesis protein FlhB